MRQGALLLLSYSDLSFHFKDGVFAGGLTQGSATVTILSPYHADFDVSDMRGFDSVHMITGKQIENYIRTTLNGKYANSPLLDEDGIGDEIIKAGLDQHVNPSFLVATAQIESGFGTEGWAANHLEWKNTVDWALPTKGYPEDHTPGDKLRNYFTKWGEGIDQIAWRIGDSITGNYYAQNLYTVDDIRTKFAFPSPPATVDIVAAMNNLAKSCNIPLIEKEFNINFIDPADTIYDTGTFNRILGASVLLE